ncbi:hypothetical protein LJR013_000580 [Pseudarthrobacter oxydans]
MSPGRPSWESTTDWTTSTGFFVSGNNSVIGNHFSEVVDSESIRPQVRRLSSSGWKRGWAFVSNNHVVAMDVRSKSSDSASRLMTPVDDRLDGLAVTADGRCRISPEYDP